ncbi:MAG: hypothetical protein R3C05_07445, partial [Pirellulaceae bacterium]
MRYTDSNALNIDRNRWLEKRILDARLKELLEAVAKRLRRQRLLWSLIAVWLASAFVIASLNWQVRSGDVSQLVACGVAAATIVGLLSCAWGISLASFRNPKTVALRIESRFPKLRQKLLTAVDQRPADGDKPLSYLQQMVIKEAIRHGKTHRWTFAANHRWTKFAWLLNSVAMLLLLFVFGGLLSKRAEADSVSPLVDSASSLVSGIGVAIEPGDAEVERGSNVIVVARFALEEDAFLPSDVALLVNQDQQQTTQAMKRNLNDPVFGGYLNEVQSDLTYRVRYDAQQSPVYKITVFDFPELKQSDAHLKFPDYTGLDEKRIEDTRRVAAVEGTRLTWFCTLNKPVREIALIADDGSMVAMSPSDGQPSTYEVAIELKESARWSLKLVDDAGRENKYPAELIARVLPNLPPQIKPVAAGDVRVS